MLDKPSGIAVHGGSGIAFGVVETLRRFEPGIPYELVHRIDRDTSGCLVLAKNRRTLLALHAQFREGAVRKRYDLVVAGYWPAAARTVDKPLMRYVLANGERRFASVSTETRRVPTFPSSADSSSRPGSRPIRRPAEPTRFAYMPQRPATPSWAMTSTPAANTGCIRALMLHASELKLAVGDRPMAVQSAAAHGIRRGHPRGLIPSWRSRAASLINGKPIAALGSSVWTPCSRHGPNPSSRMPPAQSSGRSSAT